MISKTFHDQDIFDIKKSILISLIPYSICKMVIDPIEIIFLLFLLILGFIFKKEKIITLELFILFPFKINYIYFLILYYLLNIIDKKKSKFSFSLTLYMLYQLILFIEHKTLLPLEINFLGMIIILLSFIYLWLKKSVKWRIIICYMVITSIFLIGKNTLNLDTINTLLTSSAFLILIFFVPKMKVTPLTTFGQILYACVLAILNLVNLFTQNVLYLVVLTFILQEISVLLSRVEVYKKSAFFHSMIVLIIASIISFYLGIGGII